MNSRKEQFSIMATKTFTKELTYPNEVAHVYKELDGIRLVYEDGELVGWYRPMLESEMV